MRKTGIVWLGLLAFAAGCAHHNVREGGECRSNGDCVRPLDCSGGTCVRERFSLGHKCEVDADCMGVNRCIDRKCQ